MKRKTHISFLSLVASMFVLCLAVGIAFDQTKASKPAGTIKTKVGSLAVIEQPASPMKIKGRILDSNNEPANTANIVVLPVTSYGTSIRPNNKGYFELLWSPTWFYESQSIYLIAIGDYGRKDGAFVKVTDPMQPVNVHLEPATTLIGKVIDPNGQILPKYRATLSLPTEFKCQAPIFITYIKREPMFPIIPYGPKYRLTIEAEGYQTTQLTVDAKDRSKKVIDIGTITMQPQDPTKSAVVEHKPNPDLEKEFNDIYRLDEQEVIKLIKPPFVLGRQAWVPLGLTPGMGMQYGFHWDGELKIYRGFSGQNPKLKTILCYILLMPDYDFNLPKELNKHVPHGDWIIRSGSPLTEQLRALEEIIYAELNRTIRFEKRTAERDVIVATGRFEFKPLRRRNPDWLYLYLNENDSLGGHIVSHQANSVSELLLSIADAPGIDTAIDDRTEPCEIPKIKCRCSSSLGVDMSKAKEKKLPILLDNLAKQTGLKFKVERQPAQIWFVTEAKDN